MDGRQINAFEETCAYCDRPAERWCAGVLSYPGDAQGYRRMDMSHEYCSRPMCKEHVAQHSPIFIRIKGEQKVWSWDFCKQCQTKKHCGVYAPIKYVPNPNMKLIK